MYFFPQTKPTKLDTLDCYLILAITAIAYVLHFWIIQNPPEIVFDEVYFGNFTNWYIKSQYFFDIHPPFGKILMFLMANLAEYDGSINFDTSQSNAYTNPMYITLRSTPAFFSSMCYPLIYLSARFCSFGHLASFVAAFSTLFDTSLLIEQRLILSDGMLHFCSCLFLAVFSYATSIPYGTRQWYMWTVISGFTLGMASSCKNTAWGLIAYSAAVHFLQAVTNNRGFNSDAFIETFIRGVILAIPTFSVYIGSFAAHFIFLSKSGQGDGYMPNDVKDQLVKPQQESFYLWAIRLRNPSLIFRILWLAFNMHTGNMKITNFHPSQSQPFNWPLLTGIRVLFWSRHEAIMACTGNAIVYYMVFASLFAVSLAYKNEMWMQGVRFVFAWVVSYFPFYLIPRTMYLYHYNLPLMIGGITLGVSLELWLPKFWRGFAAVFICAGAVFGLYLWGSYAYGLNPLDERFTIWNPNWKNGDAYFHSYSEAHKSSS